MVPTNEYFCYVVVYTVSLVSWHTPLCGTTVCCEKKKERWHTKMVRYSKYFLTDEKPDVGFYLKTYRVHVYKTAFGLLTNVYYLEKRKRICN